MGYTMKTIDEVRILAIGCTPAGGYERPEAFQIGVRA
jgi:hypothetical protein